MPPGLPILTFHAVDDGAAPLAFSPQRFAEGLGALAGEGWRALPLMELVAALGRPGPLPDRSFAITFDDGYRSVYEHAYPVLALHRMPATVFVALGDEPATARGRLLPMEGRERLSWTEMREMSDSGIEFGSHTLTHPDLTRLPPAEVEGELRLSRSRLEEALGRPARCFAYPYGRFDRRSRGIAAELYDAAVSDRLGLARARDDRYALPRVETYYLRAEGAFSGLTGGRLGAYLALRGAPRRLRRWLRLR